MRKQKKQYLPSLSIVIPCHNEEDVIEKTYFRLKKLLKEWTNKYISTYEIVMVNNGSEDDTLNKMLSLYKKDKNIVILDLRKNFGFQGSITAGLYNATKDMIVSIDADLQDPPKKIKEMIIKYNEGYELVLGIRSDRSSDSFFKRLSAQIFYKTLKLLGVHSVYNHGDFRLIGRNLLEELKKMGERNRYLRSMIFEVESKYACVYYKRDKREAGKTKFNLSSLISLGIDGITSFSNTPIRFISFLGIFLFSLSIILAIGILLLKIFINIKVPGWASTSIFILFFSGMQNLSMGIIGEYISKIYIETKQRPIFSIRKKYERTR